ncbi:LOW QUALITY PROTEIN: lymphocyte antigen 6 complex locus protein G6d [Trichechus manatus latirostris]|uniref:LOW QUALITY PROTEIN: lymphocyte antigen 6 complex locus protein G6d n=1 Tax=Trichechus manatus latirostris TaxID=127582 RepID=A0A2Y9QDQ1_TRIMA|nr:LOW QUALITY PROTEIN: lymphocyte antigen 6 complex locus protein G6d [Trichechus manatus latirostris]
MNPQLVGILLGTLLGAVLGNCMWCFDCRGPGSSCKEMVTTCARAGERCGFLERRPHSGSGQMKLSGNPSVTVIRHRPACMEERHCNQVETEMVGDVTYTTHRDCCLGDLCNSAVASTVVPASILTAAATALAWLLPGLWRR